MSPDHVQETAGGEYLSIKLFGLPRAGREATGAFKGPARAEKRPIAKRPVFFRAAIFIKRLQLICGFLKAACQQT